MNRSRHLVLAILLAALTFPAGLLLTPTTAIAGSAYTTVAGTPPVVTSAFYEPWLNRLVAARLANCPQARATTYYFDPTSGNNSNDGLSTGAPKQTFAAAQTLINASSGNIRIRIKGGSYDIDPASYTTAVLTTAGKVGVTIDTYTTAENQGKATLNFFSLKYNAAGWTNASGDRYTRTENNTVAWVRDQADRLGTAYTRVTSTAAVESTPLSWYWASNTLHVNAGSGVNPNTKNLESVKSNSLHGILVASGSDGSRVENIAVHGAGINPSSTANQITGISSTLSGTEEAVFVGCEAYFASSHAIAHYQGSGAGGITLWQYCKAGYCQANASGETIFNSYAANGAAETIWYGCDADYGTLPSSDWYSASLTRRGQSMYCHTNGTALSLIVAYACRTKGNTYGCRTGPQFDNTPDPGTDLSAVRSVDYLGIIEAGQHVDGGNPWMNSGARVFCQWDCRPVVVGGPSALVQFSPIGWAIGCDFDFDWSNQTGGNTAMYNGAGASSPKSYYCSFRHRRIPAAALNFIAFDYDVGFAGGTLPGNSANAELINCIVSVETLGAATYWGLNTDTSKVKNNAVFGITSRVAPQDWTASTGVVQLKAAVPRGQVPFAGSQLYQAGSTAVTLTLDMSGRRRSATLPDVGPVSSFNPQRGTNRLVGLGF